eukprot:TRINITY_DN7724_c0_g1_i1.p1 TRINITY_DN7724_c0_g1~~TRINITY_DN7724_c0_g1_i1.p1  ORF type:complete len:197 (+),score=37.12 TRINITY_DN7724_c0_g1_i1:99-689(+)
MGSAGARIQAEMQKGADVISDLLPQEVEEPQIKFPVGISASILAEDNLCRTAYCRSQVALNKGGDYAFGVDRNGFKWKCVNPRQIKGETHEGWACTALQCFDKPSHMGGVLKDGFKFDADCPKDFGVVVNDDGSPAVDAPEDAEEYPPVEMLRAPQSPDEMMSMPLPLALVPAPWPQQRRGGQLRPADGRRLVSFL